MYHIQRFTKLYIQAFDAYQQFQFSEMIIQNRSEREKERESGEKLFYLIYWVEAKEIKNYFFCSSHLQKSLEMRVGGKNENCYLSPCMFMVHQM